MAKIREGDTVLLRGEVTRVDEDGTITVLLDGIVPIRHTLRADPPCRVSLSMSTT